MINITGGKKRPTFSKYGRALDNFFMIFQPDNSKLYKAEPNPEIIKELEQTAIKFNAKSQNAKEFGTSTFRGISREQAGSYFIKHEGANRSYNPKYEFIKNKPVTYTISKTSKDPTEKPQKSPKIRPLTAKAKYYENEPKAIKKEEEIEGVEEKQEEENENKIMPSAGIRRVESGKENVRDKTQLQNRIMSAKTNISRESNKFKRKVFPCVDFEKQTMRKPFNFVSSCQNEHNFENFQMNQYTGKKILNFKQYLNRKTYLCDEAKFDLPDKFYLTNFNWTKVIPEKGKCFINFDRFQEKNNKNLETKTYLNSSVDVRDLPQMFSNLAHFKRLPSPNFKKILGRNEAKMLKERVVSASGFRPKSAFGKFSNGNTKPEIL